MGEALFLPTINGKFGLLLPKQRQIVLAEQTRPRFHAHPKFISGLAVWSEARERAERWVNLRRKQRGSIGIFTGGLIIEPAGGGTVPSVSNIVITTSVSSGISRAGIVFAETTVGSVEELVKQNGVSAFAVMGNDDAAVDHTGEWTSDSVTAADWEVAHTATASGAWDVSHAAINFFTTFATADMNWWENRSGGKGYTPGTNTVTATFTIREVADTGNSDDFQVIATAIQT